jgi:hypothetical protein
MSSVAALSANTENQRSGGVHHPKGISEARLLRWHKERGRRGHVTHDAVADRLVEASGHVIRALASRRAVRVSWIEREE